jgi:S-adenosylmethionine:tRNA ribosyltransferase-isomerase
MLLQELDFEYPERLVATERAASSRIMFVNERGEPRELGGASDLFALFHRGDCLVINNTRVLRRRVFSESGLEILFLKSAGSGAVWEVLCPSSRWKEGTKQALPGGVLLQIVSRGRPQVVHASEPLDERYFDQYGELPLPPYIQKARGERKNRSADKAQYQTAWAKSGGSLAAPTASLHFSESDLATLKARGVHVAEVTLHVGLGTFLPITASTLSEHVMHAEVADIPASTWRTVQTTLAQGGRVWALGTTVTRTLESAAHGLLSEAAHGGGFCGGYEGETSLFIRPGFEFKVVGGLITNFHQPRSTLLALVSAFTDLKTVKHAYQWAIEREFRLFSYGDLTVWIAEKLK